MEEERLQMLLQENDVVNLCQMNSFHCRNIFYHDLCQAGKLRLQNLAFKCARNALVEGFHTKKMSTKPSVGATAKESRVKGKGKHASSTENRRMVWEKIIWPLILDVNRSYFILKEYHVKRDQFYQTYKIRPSKVASSLLVKGILIREKNVYSIHYRLIRDENFAS